MESGRVGIAHRWNAVLLGGSLWFRIVVVEDKPVVGVQECSLFATQELKEETGTLQAGAEVTVEEQREWAVRVATAENKKGWVRRCFLCSLSELDRRRTAGQVPLRVICIGAKEDGRTFLYGGEMPIRMNGFALEAGQAFWMDETAKAKTFGVASHRLVGDPDVVFLYTKEDRVAKLPIWTGARTQPPTASANRQSVQLGQGLALDLGVGATMRLALVPAGTFIMGSPEAEKGRRPPKEFDETQHEVTISRPFYMSTYLVTQRQFQAVMGENPASDKGPDNPVGRVSWYDAVEFCKKLSEKVGREVSLPTEAQWEYACRAGTKTAYCFGNDDAALGDYAWYQANSENKPHPVGEKKPNAWGLYDMHGSVGEWCADWYADYPRGQVTDPKGPAAGRARVLRGGSWDAPSRVSRSASRMCMPPGWAVVTNVGFRVIVTPKPTIGLPVGNEEAGQTLNPAKPETPDWQTDVKNFRRALAKVWKEKAMPLVKSGQATHEEVSALFKEFEDKDVTRPITFEGVSENKYVAFAGWQPAKESVSLKRNPMIVILTEADPLAMKDWRSLVKGSRVECRAHIDSVKPTDLMRGNTQYVSSLVFLTVMVENARPRR